VHGHWTIEVRNRDESLAWRHEFENALNATGGFLLSRLLTREAVLGTWSVIIFDGLCPLGFGGSTACIVAEGQSGPQTAPNVFMNLTTSRVGSTVRLQGSFTTTNAGNIASVATQVSQCPSTLPGACLPDLESADAFSGTTLGTPIAVQSGQIVQVTVVLSFS